MPFKILLVTVGKAFIPIVKAIQTVQPDRVIFYCTENFKDQIVGAGLPCTVQVGNQIKRYPNILKLAQLGNNFQQNRDLKIISNPDDLADCYQFVANTIRQLQESYPDCNIFADYTGGTKTMSLGLALACLESGVSLQVNSPVTLSIVTHPSLQLPSLNNIKTKLIPKTITNSITAFRVGSFKAFSDIQYIPIRPLTLIYGANSSGKSSILHSILLTHHAIKNKGELDIYHTEAGGDSVDLGGFSQYVHKRDRSSQVQWAIDLNPKHLNLPDQGLADLLKEIKSLSVGVGIGSDSSRDGKVSVRSFYLEAEGEEIISMSSRSKGMQLDRLNSKNPIIRKLIEAIIEAQTYSLQMTPQIENAIDELVPKIIAKISGLFPKNLRIEEDIEMTSELNFTPDPTNPKQIVRFLFPYRLNQLIHAITDNIEQNMGRLHYLGPFRTYPPRHFAFSRQQDENWDSGGGYAWDILLNRADVREQVNHWLGDKKRMNTPYEITVRNLLPDSQLANELYPQLLKTLQDLTTKLILHAANWGDGIQEELERMIQDFTDAGISLDNLSNTLPEVDQLVSMMFDPEQISEEWIEDFTKKSDRISDLVLIDKRTKTQVTHRDVGIGVSQVIPILVSCYGLLDALVAIEQPEIHLHPKLQAELGDVFIQSALGQQKNLFILETHSEHLLLRIMRRMRQTFYDELPEGCPPVKPEDVSILFVDPDAKGSIVIEMPLNKKGELKKAWPGGFFEEGLEEVFG